MVDRITQLFAASLLALSFTSLYGCTHKVAVEPIEINMNIKIEHEIKVKVEKDLEDMFSQEDELF